MPLCSFSPLLSGFLFYKGVTGFNGAPHLPPCLLPRAHCRVLPPFPPPLLAGFLFYKGVTGFNEAAELQDKIDGYLDK